MPRIDYNAKLRLLISVRGHPFDRNAFDRIWNSIEGVTATMVDQPAASILMSPEAMSHFDVLVLYDMPGIDLGSADCPRMIYPDEQHRDGLRRLLRSGKGVLALHHAIAGWPAWPDYANWLGGRFSYTADEVSGIVMADSGYLQEQTHEISVVMDHPVTRGLPSKFTMTDELYLATVFDQDVTPLLRSDFSFCAKNFWSAAAAIAGGGKSREGWDHPAGSNIVGWVKRAENSPLVYLQPGDGPTAYENPTYKQLIRNAIHWLASADALEWAKDR